MTPPNTPHPEPQPMSDDAHDGMLVTAREAADGDLSLLKHAAAAGTLRVRRRERLPDADPDAGMVWPIEVGLPCINGLSCWFTIGSVYSPDRAARGCTEDALNDDLAHAFADHIVRSLAPVPPLDQDDVLRVAREAAAPFIEVPLPSILRGESDGSVEVQSAVRAITAWIAATAHSPTAPAPAPSEESRLQEARVAARLTCITREMDGVAAMIARGEADDFVGVQAALRALEIRDATRSDRGGTDAAGQSGGGGLFPRGWVTEADWPKIVGEYVQLAFAHHPVRPGFFDGETWVTIGCLTEGGEWPTHIQPLDRAPVSPKLAAPPSPVSPAPVGIGVEEIEHKIAELRDQTAANCTFYEQNGSSLLALETSRFAALEEALAIVRTRIGAPTSAGIKIKEIASLRKAAEDLLEGAKRNESIAGECVAKAKLFLIEELEAILARITASAEAGRGSGETQAAILKKLDDDSLDAIMEVIGEGAEFAAYNRGKSAMRDWFLGRLRRMWSIPADHPTPVLPSHHGAER